MRTDKELGHVIARHVFDHRATGANDAAIGEGHGGRHHQVAQRTMAQALGRIEIRRHQAANGCVCPGRSQRRLHLVFSQERLQVGQGCPRAHGDIEVFERKLGDAVKSCTAQPHISSAQIAAGRAADAYTLARRCQPCQGRGRFLRRGRRKGVASGKSGSFIVGRGQFRREDLAGVEQRLGVEDRFDLGHRRQFCPAKHHGHVRTLFDAHAMLPRDRAVALDTELDDGFARQKDLFLDFQVAGIEGDAGVQVAIAGMENVAQDETVVVADFVDRGEGVGEAAARDGDVYQIEVRSEARQRTRCALASVPDLGALGFALGNTQVITAVALQDVADLLHLCIEAGRVAVYLDNQRGFGIDGQADGRKGFDDLHDALIHHFERGGNQSGGDDRRDCLARGLFRVKSDHQRLDARWIADKARVGAGGNGERAFAAHHQPRQVIFGIV